MFRIHCLESCPKVDPGSPFLTAGQKRSKTFPKLELPLDGGLSKKERQFNDSHPSCSLQLGMIREVEATGREGRELETSRCTSHGIATWCPLSWVRQGLGLIVSLSKKHLALQVAVCNCVELKKSLQTTLINKAP